MVKAACHKQRRGLRVTSSVVGRPAASNDAPLPLVLPPLLTLLFLSPTRCSLPTIWCTRLAVPIRVLVVRTEPSTRLCTAIEQQAILQAILPTRFCPARTWILSGVAGLISLGRLYDACLYWPRREPSEPRIGLGESRFRVLYNQEEKNKIQFTTKKKNLDFLPFF